MSIKALVEVINSKPDRFGNCYFVFVLTDVVSNKTVVAKFLGNVSNIRAALREGFALEFEEFRIFEKEQGIRDFKRWTKNLEYAGCSPEEISEYIKRRL